MYFLSFFKVTSEIRNLKNPTENGNVLWPFGAKLLLSVDVTDVSLSNGEFITKIFQNCYFVIFKRSTNLFFSRGPSRISNEKKKFWNCLFRVNIHLYIYPIWQRRSHCTSNLIYIASCVFIPSQYDVYWPLSNAVLSGAISKCLFHNRNIFTH